MIGILWTCGASITNWSATSARMAKASVRQMESGTVAARRTIRFRISAMLDALTEKHADAPHTDPLGYTGSQAGVFERIAHLQRQQHGKTSGLCLLCVTTEDEH